MANRLKMVAVETIVSLLLASWPQRKIARELGISRDAVRHYAKLLRLGKLSVVLPPGWPGPSGDQSSEASDGSSPGDPTAPASDSSCTTRPPDPLVQNLPGGAPGSDEPKQAGAPPGSTASTDASSAQSASDCEPFRQVILDKLEQGLSRKRIWQDLVTEHGFTARYHSVKRFVRKLNRATPLPFRRIEVEPGAEAQVDFGKGAPVCPPSGGRRRTHVFRIVLSFSRKGYSEAVFSQTTDEFLACLENAFWSFGGVPRIIVIDNLKAAVAKADWFDPELHPKIRSFCQHYGCSILPTRPYTPRHKGKVESGVNFVQSNGLKGHSFAGLPEENQHLWHWELTVADTRIHGTTRKQVGKLFAEVEKPALLPLPAERFPFFHEAQRSVHLDGYVQIAHSYYSVPPEYVGRTVWVRWDQRTVRVFNHRFEQITFHVRRDHGDRFNTLNGHIPQEKRSGVEQGVAYWLRQASLIGQQADRWAQQMLLVRGVEGIRVLQGLLHLTKRHPAEAIDRACQVASSRGLYYLRAVREATAGDVAMQEQFAFIDQHPMIRNLTEYGQLVRAAFGQEPFTLPAPQEESL